MTRSSNGKPRFRCRHVARPTYTVDAHAVTVTTCVLSASVCAVSSVVRFKPPTVVAVKESVVSVVVLVVGASVVVVVDVVSVYSVVVVTPLGCGVSVVEEVAATRRVEVVMPSPGPGVDVTVEVTVLVSWVMVVVGKLG